MPPRARKPTTRAGARPGAIAEAVVEALRAEQSRLDGLPTPLERAKAVGDFFAAADAEMERIAAIRNRAIVVMRRDGMSQRAIGDAIGVTKQRIGQILKDQRFQ